MIIKMEPNVRNYLYRLLEEQETKLDLKDEKEYERQLNLIRIAKARLTGKEPAMSLTKESSLMSILED